MSMVSKADIKAALLEKYQVSQKNLLGEGVISTVDATVENTSIGALQVAIVNFIGEYFTRVGHDLPKAGGAVFQTDTAKILAGDLKKTMRHIRINEIRLAMEYGSKGVFGEVKHCSVSTIEEYLMKYLLLPERIAVKEEIKKEENERNNAKLLATKTEWTAEDHVKAMRKRYNENLHRIDQSKDVLDVGGLLFDHMIKEGLIEVTEEDKKQVVLKMQEMQKSDKWNPVIKKQITDLLEMQEGKTHPLVRDHVLTKYFTIEVAMRNEAIKIKEQEKKSA
jgi:hypothetical protein